MKLLVLFFIVVVGLYLLCRYRPATGVLLKGAADDCRKYIRGIITNKQCGARDAYLESANQRMVRLQESLQEEIELQQKTEIALQEKTIAYDTLISEVTSLRQSSAAIKKQLDELSGKFFFVPNEVSCQFCEEYRQIHQLVVSGNVKLVSYLEIVTDKRQELSSSLKKELLEYFNIVVNWSSGNDLIGQWYVSLNSASAIRGDAIIDLQGKISAEAQLLFLRQYAFTEYYRQALSSLLLIFEHLRVECDAPLAEKIANYLYGIIHTAQEFGYQILYIPSLSVCEVKDFSNLDVHVMHDASNFPINYVSKVLKIGVNSAEFEVPVEKSIIEMNI